MTKSILETIRERDQMYSEYIREISLRFGGKLSNALSVALFDKEEIKLNIDNINIVPQNINYAFLQISIVCPAKAEAEAPGIISFAIPFDILEHGTIEDITEYVIALKNDTEAKHKPVDDKTSDIDYVKKIVDRVTTKQEEISSYNKVSELDEVQLKLMETMKVKETKH